MSKIRSFYWKKLLKFHGASVGKNFSLNGSLNILLRDGAEWSNIKIGDNVSFDGDIFIRVRKNGRIIIKNGVKMGTHVWLVAANDNDLVINEKSNIGSYNIFNGGHGFEMGKYCITAAFVYINSSDHYHKKGEYIQNQGFYGDSIIIGNDVWLGGHVFVNTGIEIGSGSVIGAGSVVTKNIPENSIAVGVPAKIIKKRE
jgi:acetyltransferase-like isoleucine patch superfamily enzyme